MDKQHGEPVLGRPRIAGRTQDIIDAATSLLDQVGYDNITIQAIADSAGVGLATIYRRWASKDDVLVDAIASLPKPTIAATGDARADLEAFVRLQVDTFTDHTNRLPGLLVAMRASAAIAEAVRSDITREVHQPLFDLLLAADVPTTVAEQLAELVPALLIYRLVIMGQPINADEFVNELQRHLPILDHHNGAT